MEYTDKVSHSGRWMFTGLVVGACVGAVAALMLTPKTGSENRQMVKDRWDDVRHKADDLRHKVRGTADRT